MTSKLFTWEEFDKAVHRLSLDLSGYQHSKFDKIYGIPRGGLILAVALSHELEKPLTLELPKNTDRVLVVDDISDTGTTLGKIRPKLSATIHVVRDTTFMPNFHVLVKNPGDWIIYPWERK